jgi:hypothetical protein
VSADQILVTGRVIERILVCVFAGASLLCGWNLFRVGVVTEQSAGFSGKGISANLRRVGPGIFFALFGSIVLSLALRAPLDIGPVPAGQSLDAKSAKTSELENRYLYRVSVQAVDALDIEYRNRAVNGDEAYRRLRTLVQESERQ